MKIDYINRLIHKECKKRLGRYYLEDGDDSEATEYELQSYCEDQVFEIVLTFLAHARRECKKEINSKGLLDYKQLKRILEIEWTEEYE